MDSDDTVGTNFRKGKRVIKIPLKGSQKIEFKNISKEEVSLSASLHSSRFSILNTRKTSFHDYYKFEMDLSPDNSIVIVIEDNGHVDLNKLQPTYTFEGVFKVTVKEISQSIFLIPDPETRSFKELRLYRDRHAVCELLELHNGEVEKFVSIEPIPDSKYGETLPNNVKTLKLSADDIRHNKRRDILNSINAVNRDLEPSEFQREMDLVMENYEKDRKAQQELNKLQQLSAEPESKRSEKSDAKSSRTDQLTSVASQSKKSEKSEAKSMTENPKLTLKSEKTTKSEMVRKSGKVDFPELKNKEKKKRKKKKRCVIC
ncbi:unnamed protein product [Caenorhabditis brenneri]